MLPLMLAQTVVLTRLGRRGAGVDADARAEVDVGAATVLPCTFARSVLLWLAMK